MSPDQYTFADPRTIYPSISPPVQQQPEPGIQAKMEPVPDLGEDTYRGTGRLEGRKALITGGDSGIGGAVAIAFAREGADVTLSYLPDEEEDARHIVSLVEDAGRKAVTHPGDLKDKEYCRSLVDAAVDGMGGLDIIVSNAGRQIWVERIEDLSDEQFEDTMFTNVFGMFWLMKAAVPHLAPGSSIICTTSLEAYDQLPSLLDYATTKGAVNTFSKALAQQLGPRGIRVNAVAPGPTWSALQVSHGFDPEQLPEYGKESLYGRAGQPAELAPAYVFLASAESSFVMGETLNVNGGQATP